VQFKASRCFRCFSTKFTANRIAFAAEILDSGGLEPPKNSEISAVFLPFSAVFGPAIEFREDDDTNYAGPSTAREAGVTIPDP